MHPQEPQVGIEPTTATYIEVGRQQGFASFQSEKLTRIGRIHDRIDPKEVTESVRKTSGFPVEHRARVIRGLECVGLVRDLDPRPAA